MTNEIISFKQLVWKVVKEYAQEHETACMYNNDVVINYS